MASWFQKNQNRWVIEQSIAQRLLEDVYSGTDDGRAFIEGTLALRLPSDHVLDRYRIRIVYPERFLKRRCHPDVYLISHRDVWKAYPGAPNGHLEHDWRMCLYVPLESGLDFERTDELERLLQNIATYLFRQRIYQRELAEEDSGGPPAVWPGPDRAHGLPGLKQAIQATGRKLGRNEPCVCGTGTKFKNCCYKKLYGMMATSRGLFRKRRKT